MANGINSNYQQYMGKNINIDNPELQGKIEKAKQSVTTNVESNSAAQIINSNTQPKSLADTAKYFVPIYIADKFIDGAIGGKGNGILGKIAGLGDKISNTFKLNNIISKKSGSKISNFIKNNRFTKYFTNYYKAIAKSSMAKSHTMTEGFTQSLIGELKKAGLELSEKTSVDELIKQANEFIKNNPGTSQKISILKNDIINNARAYNLEKNSYEEIYNMEKWKNSQDKYDVYLSGATPIITVENPNGPEGKELLLFRDSFGSSIAPLLLENYQKITLVDLRYVSSTILDNYIDFNNQDVLFLYSTVVLNQNILK